MRTAVVLLNLGGPSSLKAVKPFLYSLFNDKAILRLPQPLRGVLAWWIASGRTPEAQKIYRQIGGSSPILAETERQAQALERRLSGQGDYKVFLAMRHSQPSARETVRAVRTYAPARIVLLPLYPQFSTTTTKSAFRDWNREARKAHLHVPHHPVCCYPFDAHFIDAHVAKLKPAYDEAARFGTPRILFSAHGLPVRIVERGDPYAWQVERTVAAVMRKFAAGDYRLCYQSRVGKLEWLGPSIDEEIARAGADKVPVVVVPIAFVNEHSETLVELDMLYRGRAQEAGVPHYVRVPALGIEDEFIETLAWLCEATRLYPHCSNALGRICPKEFAECGFKEWGKRR